RATPRARPSPRRYHRRRARATGVEEGRDAGVPGVHAGGLHGLLGKQEVPAPRLAPPRFAHAFSGTGRQSLSITMLPAASRTQHAAFFGPFVRPHDDCFTSRLRALMTPAFRCALGSVLIASFTHLRSAPALPLLQLQAAGFK